MKYKNILCHTCDKSEQKEGEGLWCNFWNEMTIPSGVCHGHQDYESLRQVVRAAAEIVEALALECD